MKTLLPVALALLPALGLAQTLTLTGTGGSNASHDVTAFVDKVEIVRAADGAVVSGALSNAGFETPAQSSGGYTYNPTGGSWTFAGGTGIAYANPTSGFAAPSTPDGSQVAFLQNTANSPSGNSLSQALALSAGTYQVRFLMAQRQCCNTPYDQGIVVMVGGVQLGTALPTANYSSYTSGLFTLNRDGTVSVGGTVVGAMSFAYTGGPQTYTVPAGVTQLAVVAAGACGGYFVTSSNSSPGAQVRATVTVVPGEVLTVVVGGQSLGNAGGYNGGGAVGGKGNGSGSGATDLRRSGPGTGDYLTSRNALLVAGGGGGSDNSSSSGPDGGAGGTPNGGDGSYYIAGAAGGGATQTAPGRGGYNSGMYRGQANPGSDSNGGSTTTMISSGGGGGYYGGGASAGGGGGGGSSWVMPTGSSAITYTLASSTGNGFLTLAPATTPLPVQLVAFTVAAAGPGAHLRWSTASEVNNDHFEVEASPDGRSFVRLGQVAGHGTSLQPQQYTFTDEQPTHYGVALVYYRLRQVDRDGTANYSPVRTLAVEPTGLTLYPNPAARTATLSGAAAGVLVQVYDALGSLVLTTQADTSGTAILRLPASLPGGLYLVRSGDKPAVRLTIE